MASPQAVRQGLIRAVTENRLKQAGLRRKRVSAHSLRHTSATLAFQKGAGLVAVKEMLRHSNINTTMIYVHNLNRLTSGAENFIDF